MVCRVFLGTSTLVYRTAKNTTDIGWQVRLVSLAKLGTRYFWAFTLSRSRAEPFEPVLLRSFFNLKLRAFAFALQRSWLFRAPTFALLFSIRARAHAHTRHTHTHTRTPHPPPNTHTLTPTPTRRKLMENGNFCLSGNGNGKLLFV